MKSYDVPYIYTHCNSLCCDSHPLIILKGVNPDIIIIKWSNVAVGALAGN